MDRLGPKAHGEIRIGAAPSCDQVVLGGSDAAFSAVATVIVGWNELVLDLFVIEEGEEFLGVFVIHALEFGFAARFLQSVMDNLAGFSSVLALRLATGCIRIAFAYNHEIVHSFIRRDGEASCEIGVHLVFGCCDCNETQV